MAVGRARAGPRGVFPVDLTPPGAAIAPPAPLWPALPQRALTNGGVPFRPGEPVAVTGLDAARRGDFFPTRVAGLAVRRKAARLHVLHGADHSDKDGVPLAELVLLYANGERRALRLAYGLHARSLTREKGEKIRAARSEFRPGRGGRRSRALVSHDV